MKPINLLTKGVIALAALSTSATAQEPPVIQGQSLQMDIGGAAVLSAYLEQGDWRDIAVGDVQPWTKGTEQIQRWSTEVMRQLPAPNMAAPGMDGAPMLGLTVTRVERADTSDVNAPPVYGVFQSQTQPDGTAAFVRFFEFCADCAEGGKPIPIQPIVIIGPTAPAGGTIPTPRPLPDGCYKTPEGVLCIY